MAVVRIWTCPFSSARSSSANKEKSSFQIGSVSVLRQKGWEETSHLDRSCFESLGLVQRPNWV